jgi:sec-independent protein translocase protein TatB
MFDLDIGKMMVVAVVALAVIPPKDLPRVMRTVGQFMGRMRRMAAEFQGQFMDAMREADLESVRKELEDLKKQTNIEATFDPVGMVRDDVTKAAGKLDTIGTSEVSLTEPTPVVAETHSVQAAVLEPSPAAPEIEAQPPHALEAAPKQSAAE